MEGVSEQDANAREAKPVNMVSRAGNSSFAGLKHLAQPPSFSSIVEKGGITIQAKRRPSVYTPLFWGNPFKKTRQQAP